LDGSLVCAIRTPVKRVAASAAKPSFTDQDGLTTRRISARPLLRRSPCGDLCFPSMAEGLPMQTPSPDAAVGPAGGAPRTRGDRRAHERFPSRGRGCTDRLAFREPRRVRFMISPSLPPAGPARRSATRQTLGDDVPTVSGSVRVGEGNNQSGFSLISPIQHQGLPERRSARLAAAASRQGPCTPSGMPGRAKGHLQTPMSRRKEVEGSKTWQAIPRGWGRAH
jgi:hypothetical protein